MIAKLKRMKAEPGDKLVKESCHNCEFNFGNVCGGHGIRKDNGKDTYRMPMEEAIAMFTEGCEGFGISLKAFIKQEKMNGIQIIRIYELYLIYSEHK